MTGYIISKVMTPQKNKTTIRQEIYNRRNVHYTGIPGKLARRLIDICIKGKYHHGDDYGPQADDYQIMPDYSIYNNSYSNNGFIA